MIDHIFFFSLPPISKTAASINVQLKVKIREKTKQNEDELHVLSSNL